MSNIFTQTLLKMPPIARITEAESDSQRSYSAHTDCFTQLLHFAHFSAFMRVTLWQIVLFPPLSFIFCLFLSLYFLHTPFLFYTPTDVCCVYRHFPNTCHMSVICLPTTLLSRHKTNRHKPLLGLCMFRGVRDLSPIQIRSFTWYPSLSLHYLHLLVLWYSY